VHPLNITSLLVLAQVASIAAAQNRASDSLIQREEVALRAAADQVADSVVQIRTIGGLEKIDSTLLATGPTTGLIISSDGYILSSAFNFVQQPASILVSFASGAQAPARLIATDHSRMLVLLKAVGVDELPVPRMAPVEDVRVGQWAIAVGRTFLTEQINMSVGILSAKGRMFGKVLQTDAAVSAANYGGPLVDIRGHVLGLLVPMSPNKTSQVAGAEWYDSGIGFAVPLASLQKRLEKMKQGEDQHTGLLGIRLKSGNSHELPAQIEAVRPNTPANEAELKKGDHIVELNGKPIATQTDLRFQLGPLYAGEQVQVVILRDEERIVKEITLASKLAISRKEKKSQKK